MAIQTKGLCKYCGKEYAKGGMLRHLTACKSRKMQLNLVNKSKKCGYFEVIIWGKYDKNYWLIIEISEKVTLRDLDGFIRDIWVECCGHLSMFWIDGIPYEACPDMDHFFGLPAKSMNCKLKKVFSVGKEITYEYDFGSTTELMLKVHSYRVGEEKELITILSRNNPLGILCSQCGKQKAQWVDSEAFYDENPFWCENCLEKANMEADELDEYRGPVYPLPVCNSPRMGMCGYEGSDIYPDQFQPDESQDSKPKYMQHQSK